MSLFSLVDITRVYDRRNILDIPELEIEENRIHALSGAERGRQDNPVEYAGIP